jgi:RNA polymerase sigma factor (sigma-70 family)
MLEAQQLLSQYVKDGSEDAFGELVNRYIDLVYSAAVRLLNQDTHLAEDVTQTVFLDLAQQARTLSPKVMLGGWLHRHTCFVASKTLRAQRRRQLREQHSVEMNPMQELTGAEFVSVAPLLDDAINQLGAEDRTAILARFYEQRDFRAVGEALGSTEEAARKRVNRALEKLHLLLKQRGVSVSVAALSSVLATEAVTAAPAGLAAGVAAGAVAGAAVSNATSLTVLKIMSMTKLKTGLAAALVAAFAVPLALQHRTQTRLQQENEALQRQVQTIDQLTAENQRLADLLAQAAVPLPTRSAQTQSQEVLRLRGEVGRLRREQAEAAGQKPNGPSPVSALLDSPEIHKRIRSQQRASMGAVYEDFVQSANLSSNQVEQFQDILADNVMTNVARISSVLREGKSREEVDQVFKEQETALQNSLQALLGPENFTQYQDYTRSLWSRLTSEGFTSMLDGEAEVLEQQAQRLRQVMQEEAQTAVANAGRDPDFQLVPFLNLRNIASEEETEKNLALLDSVYERVGIRAAEFLSPEELKKFAEFRQYRINENRMILTINRKMMAPAPTGK